MPKVVKAPMAGGLLYEDRFQETYTELLRFYGPTMDTKDVCSFYKCGRKKARSIMLENKIPSNKVGKKWIYHSIDIARKAAEKSFIEN